MTRTPSVVFALAAAFAGTAACKNDSAHKADKAAHALDDADKQDEKLSRAEDQFAVQRQTRIDVLRAEHAVIATQPQVVQMLATALPLTDVGRADVSEKLTVFEMRLDESGHAIAALQDTPATAFAKADDAISKAMTGLNDARKSAWKALSDAPRLDKTSSL